ncbi:MAG: ABC transporter ATP-binding protein [Planctomycetota bacterium]
MLPAAFMHFVRRLFRYPVLLACAVVMAIVSAMSLGGGLLALKPILDVILEQGGTLATLAADWSAESEQALPGWLTENLPDEPYSSLVWMVVGVGILTVFGATANFVHMYLSATLIIRVISDVRRSCYRRMLRLPLGELAANRSMDLVSRTLSDSQHLASGLSAVISKALAHSTKAIAGVVVAFVIDWRLTLITMLALPVLGVVIRKIAKVIRRASRGAMQSTAGLMSAAEESVNGLRVVKVHGAEGKELGRFVRVNRDLVKDQMRARTARALSSPLTETIGILVLGTLALIAGKAIIEGNLSPSAFVLALGGLALGASELKKITGLINDIQVGEAAAQRLLELLNKPTETVHARERAAIRLPRHTESLVFDGVRFAYNEGQEVLKGVDLEIRFGERLAVVGANGSGKTTLLSLVPRLYEPSSGRILIDDIDVSTVTLRSLRKQIGVVTQDTVLFRGTIAENVVYGSSTDLGRIESALDAACAANFVSELPEGIHTMVGEHGQTLSGGQRQRLAIARAIYRDPAILIMDEATSMIDAESEAAMNESMARFSEGRTTIIIAHRLATVLAADRIVVLGEGRVLDTGSHDELMSRCKAYQAVARHQLAGSVVS